MSILRLPLSMVLDGYSLPDSGANCRAPADGGHVDTPFGRLTNLSNCVLFWWSVVSVHGLSYECWQLSFNI